jgi:hypothetical protein
MDPQKNTHWETPAKRRGEEDEVGKQFWQEFFHIFIIFMYTLSI